MKNTQNIAIASSGDAERDVLAIEKFCRESELIDAGMCPNGCGGMMAIDSHNAECPRCHFVYFCSSGLKTDGIPKC
jgi:ribosomal protein S27AE